MVASDPAGAAHLGTTAGGAAPYGPLCGGRHGLAGLAAAAVAVAAHNTSVHVDCAHAATAAGAEILRLHFEGETSGSWPYLS